MPRFATVPDGVSYTEVVGERASNAGAILFTFVVFALVLCVVVGAWQLAVGSVTACPVVLGVILAALASMSVHIAQQWEKVVVLRLGAFNRVSGPGLFWTWPIIEQNTMRVDTRVRVTTFGAEETLTADLVPLNVNAVLFWHVWDAKAACTEVGDFSRTTDFDPDYYVNFEEIGTKHPIFRCWHISEDYFLLQLYKKGADDMIHGGTSADVSELAIFKAEDRTIIPVTGLPAEGKFGGEPYGENGYAYMAVTVTTGEHPAFYKIDTKTGKAVKGLTVEADAITTVGKMKYPSK